MVFQLLMWPKLETIYMYLLCPLRSGTLSRSAEGPKINNSRPDMLLHCCQDLEQASLMLPLLPQEKLQIDPQDWTPGSYFSWAAMTSSLYK